MTAHIARAITALKAAEMYAEDGAVITAIMRTKKALALLNTEKQRRQKIGLYPKDKEK